MVQNRYAGAWAAPSLLTLCAALFGWVGLATPLIWLALYAIEVNSGWKHALGFIAAGILMLIAVIPGRERIELMSAYIDGAGNTVVAIALVAFILRLRLSIRLADTPYILAAIVVPFICGLVLLRPSVKLATTIAVAALINLLVVCISEEGFFR